MSKFMTRRSFLGRTALTGAVVALAGGSAFAQEQNMGTTDGTIDPFPIPRVDLRKIPPQFRRQIVEYLGHEWPGTVVVDTKNKFLFKFITSLTNSGNEFTQISLSSSKSTKPPKVADRLSNEEGSTYSSHGGCASTTDVSIWRSGIVQ